MKSLLKLLNILLRSNNSKIVSNNENKVLNQVLLYNLPDKTKIDIFKQTIDIILEDNKENIFQAFYQISIFFKRIFLINQNFRQLAPEIIKYSKNLIAPEESQLDTIKLDKELKKILRTKYTKENALKFSRIIMLNPEVNQKTKNQALIWSCTSNDLNLVQFVLKLHPNIDCTNKNKQTPLILAIESDNPSIVQEILNHKPNINLKDKNNNTALMYAVSKGNEHIVSLIINEKADTNIENKFGINAFILACIEGRENIVKLFLNNLNMEYNKARQFAQKAGNYPIVKMIDKEIQESINYLN